MNPTYKIAYILTKRRERNILKTKSGSTYYFSYKYEYSRNSVNQAHSDILTRLNFEVGKFQNDKISSDTSKGKF